MFAIFKTAAVLLPLLGGVGSGAAVAGAAFWAWNKFIDNPSLVRTQQAICVSTVELAAERARNEERERQAEISRMLTRAFNDQISRMQQEQVARQEALEQEIEDYESHLTDEDRACTGLTESMRSFVLGN